MFLETIFLIAFNYFLLHFIKNINIIYGIFITLFFLMFIFGNFFHDEHFSENNYFLSWNYKEGDSSIFIISTYITTILTPWQNFRMIGKNLSYHTEKSLNEYVFYWWNTSYLGVYYNNQPNFWFQNFKYISIVFTFLYIVFSYF